MKFNKEYVCIQITENLLECYKKYFTLEKVIESVSVYRDEKGEDTCKKKKRWKIHSRNPSEKTFQAMSQYTLIR